MKIALTNLPPAKPKGIVPVPGKLYRHTVTGCIVACTEGPTKIGFGGNGTKDYAARGVAFNLKENLVIENWRFAEVSNYEPFVGAVTLAND